MPAQYDTSTTRMLEDEATWSSLYETLIAMFLGLNTRAASPASAATITTKVINADGGVYWRFGPDWNTPTEVMGQGIYTGDTVALECYWRGGTVPPYYNNPLWYEIVSGHSQGSGWVNDHYLSTRSPLDRRRKALRMRGGDC